jgi:hypothetical protein
MIAALDGPVTWQVAASVLVVLFFGLVLLGILAEIANWDDDEGGGS